MNGVSQSIRSKRFEVAEGHVVTLTCSMGGVEIELLVSNTSVNGLLAAAETLSDEARTALVSGSIVPSAKIPCNGTAHDLGRLAVRRLEVHDGWTFIAFSCVDGRVPLYGAFGRQFHVDPGSEDPFAMELGAGKFSLADFAQADYDSPDLFQKCRDFERLHKDMVAQDRMPCYGVRHQVNGAQWRMSLPAHPRPRNYVSFASYDYLGLSQDPEVHEALRKAVERYGISATAAPVNAGQSAYHEELEHYLARMLRKEDCFLFASGFGANVGAITSLLGGNDLAVADFQSHASLQDGLGAVKARVRHFRHNDNDHFARILAECRQQHAGALAITEGLFSMDGDIPDLRAFTRIAREHGARTLIDEVHSFGIFGSEGQGVAEQQGVLDEIDLYTGSLSKVPGTGGGFIAGSKAAIGWMRFYARCGMFSTALSPCFAAASLKSIEIIRRDGSRRKKLHENIKHFRDGLASLGIPLISHPQSPIVPVVIPDADKLVQAHQRLLAQGIFVNLITYPAVAINEGRLRFSITCHHNYSDIELALAGLQAVQFREIDRASEPSAC